MIFIRPDGSTIDLSLPRAESETPADAFIDSLRFHYAKGRSWSLIARIHGLSLVGLIRRLNDLLEARTTTTPPKRAGERSTSDSGSSSFHSRVVLTHRERVLLGARLYRLSARQRTAEVLRWCEDHGISEIPPRRVKPRPEH